MAFNKNYGIAAVNLYFIFSIFRDLVTKWSSLPDAVPAHFNSKDEPDLHVSKYALWIIPFGSIIVLAITLVLGRNPPRKIIPIELTEVNEKAVLENTESYLYILGCVVNSFLRVINASLIHSKKLRIYPIVSFATSLFFMSFYYLGTVSKVTKELERMKEKKDRAEAKKAEKATFSNNKRTNKKKKRN